MSGFGCARVRLVDKLPCASDVSEAPSRVSQISGRSDVRILTEAVPGFTISLGVVDSQRLFQMRPRVLEIALEEASQSQTAMCGRRLRRSRRAFHFAQEALGPLPGQP